jgi:hypothetical protein
MSKQLAINVRTLAPSENLFTTVQALLDLLPEAVEVTFEDAETFVSVGSATPDEESQNSPWFRQSQTGDFLGLHMYVGGEWRLAPSIPIGSVIGIANLDTTNIPYGFEIANGDNNTVDRSADFEPVPYPDPGRNLYDYGFIQYVGIANA